MKIKKKMHFKSRDHQIKKYINEQNKIFLLGEHYFLCLVCNEKVTHFDTKFRGCSCNASSPDFGNPFLKNHVTKYESSFFNGQNTKTFEDYVREQTNGNNFYFSLTRNISLLNTLLLFLASRYPAIRNYIVLKNKQGETGLYPLKYFQRISSTKKNQLDDVATKKFKHNRFIRSREGNIIVDEYWIYVLKVSDSFVVKTSVDTIPFNKKIIIKKRKKFIQRPREEQFFYEHGF